MKRIPLKPISPKRKKILADEAIVRAILLEACGGNCMMCGQRKPLEKSHTRGRGRFILICHSCHFPQNRHRYLEALKGEGEPIFDKEGLAFGGWMVYIPGKEVEE